MKIKILVLTLAAATSAPAYADIANIIVYGRAHISFDSNAGNAPANATTDSKDGLNLVSNVSNLGFKGEEDLGDGLKAIFQYETEIFAQGSSSLLGSQRNTFAGLKSEFGTLRAGRLPLANQYVGDVNFLEDKVGDSGNLTTGGFAGLGLLYVPGRINRALSYTSPTMAGTTLTLGFVPNTPQSMVTASSPQNSLGKDVSFTLRAAYENNGLFAAANYLSLGITGMSLASTPIAAAPSATAGTIAAPVSGQAGAKLSVLSLAGGYDFGVAKVRAQYVSTDANQAAAYSVGAGTGAKQVVFALGGQYNITEKSALKIELVNASDASLNGVTVANTGANLLALGYDYALSKRSTLYAAYAKVNNGAAAQFSATGYGHSGVGSPGVAYSPSALSVGLILTF